MEANDLLLQKTFRYLELITILLIALTQLGWVCNVIEYHWLVTASFVLFGIAAALATVMPNSTRGRLILLLIQIAVMSAACALGPSRRYVIYFLVLAAKAAVQLPRKQMLFVAFVLLLARVLAGVCSEYVLHHFYIHRFLVPHFYSKVVVEAELKLAFLIGLTIMFFLGRIVVSERRSRRVQEMLGQEAKELAVDFERNKLAADIHDTLGHTLASLGIQLELAVKLVKDNKLDTAKELVRQSYESAIGCLQEIRRAVTTIRNDQEGSEISRIVEQ